MNKNISIQAKAAFLIIVFSLNTIIGFACAIGIDMGFNATHHHEEEGIQAPLHIHADGKKHIHENGSAKHHDEAGGHPYKSKEGKDGCCNDKVIQFARLEKSIPPSLRPTINFVLFGSFIPAFYSTDVLFTSRQFRNIKYFVRGHHPPIPDIRIAIQSFRI